ncbi:ribosomal-processing cysteine protease Prp [Proteinivorax hydrogeniformans]|uniref:Ribosomal processing cysteine protease Prp n=1 Tax=Proteinivorax hydrogeniformans TaxID=1826727 RepID=A0AAU8HWJ1_9FIRM
MIKVKVSKDEKGFLGYVVTGHAQYADRGSDIVCAGASSLTQTTAITLEEKLNLNLDIEVDDEKGYLHVIYPKDLSPSLRQNVDLITEHMLIGLKEIEKQFGQYISVKVIEN